jgi:hypothetical protein
VQVLNKFLYLAQWDREGLEEKGGRVGFEYRKLRYYVSLRLGISAFLQKGICEQKRDSCRQENG